MDDKRDTFFCERDDFANFHGGLRGLGKLVHGLHSDGVDFDDIAFRDVGLMGIGRAMEIGP